MFKNKRAQRYYERHRAQCIKAARTWYLANKERAKPAQKRALLKARYGITDSQYDAMLADQDGGCALCRATTNYRGYRLAVDHDHTTGKIRGLLCFHCNLGIGNLKDSPILLRAALDYIEKGRTSWDGKL